MMHARVSRSLDLVLVMAAVSLTCPAEETPAGGKDYPLWDGKEAVAEYAKRAGLDPGITLELGDGVKMGLVLIPAGKFVMGSPEDEQDRYKVEGPQHDVTLGKPFYMGKSEVTQEQYEKLIKVNPSHFKGARNPVEQVSWDDAQAFCKKLGEKTGRTVRLPSEAEWEYACRAGSKTPLLGRVAWYGENSDKKTHPVGEKEPNALGLFDMLGNVWEWVEDDGHGSYANAPADGSAWIGNPRGALRVLRGGSWYGHPRYCRSAYRFGLSPETRYDVIGFRVVVAPSSSKTP